MMPFDLTEPRSLAGAIAALDGYDPAVPPIASGTALTWIMTDKATRLETEHVLKGAALEDASPRRAGELAAAEAEYVADARGSAAYKRELIRVSVGSTIRAAANDGRAE